MTPPSSSITKSDIDKIVDAINTLTIKVDTLYEVIVTGNPKENKPSLLETVRSHGNFIYVIRAAFWVFACTVIAAIPAFLWYTSLHVAQAGK